jgi:hypothetical protein
LTVALILIYAVPTTPKMVFPELSCLQMIAYLPYIFLFTMLAKDYQRPAAATAAQTGQAAPQPESANTQTWTEPPRS